MKKTLFLTATLLLLIFIGAAQNKKLPLNENKYRINLPDYWEKGNKIWEILTDKLPLVCEELKDKDLCGDNCNPKYIIEFYMTDPELIGYNRYKKQQSNSTNTRVLLTKFPNLSLVPNSNTPPRDPYLYDQNPKTEHPEEWQMFGEYVFQCFLLLRDDSKKLLTRIILVDTNEVWISEYKHKASESQFSSDNPDVFFEKNKDKFVPSKLDLFAIVDQKIHDLK